MVDKSEEISKERRGEDEICKITPQQVDNFHGRSAAYGVPFSQAQVKPFSLVTRNLVTLTRHLKIESFVTKILHGREKTRETHLDRFVNLLSVLSSGLSSLPVTAFHAKQASKSR